jgi:hypothetical protein
MLITDPVLVIAVQLLEGISGAVLGLLQPLVIDDPTGRTARFNVAYGFVGTASGFGASVYGLIAGTFGLTAGSIAITAIALIAFPDVGLDAETKPHAASTTIPTALSH